MSLYGFSNSEFSERWCGSEDSIAGAIYAGLQNFYVDEVLPIFVCDACTPDVGYAWLAENCVERITESLEEEVGEAAEAFGPFDLVQMGELAALIEGWVEKHGGISCWKADNIRKFEAGMPEYDAALKRFFDDRVMP